MIATTNDSRPRATSAEWTGKKQEGAAMQIISRAEAKRRGLKREPCKHGHVDWRVLNCGVCAECVRAVMTGRTVLVTKPIKTKRPRLDPAAEIFSQRNFENALSNKLHAAA